MSKQEKMDINISKSYYNRLISKDGIHYEELSEKRPYYALRIGKNYFDIDSEIELKKQMLEDFREIEKVLEKEIKKELEKGQER